LSSISFSESLCRSRHFEKPTRSEFQTYMRETLRTAKERFRNRTRNPRARAQKERIQQDFWNDEREDDVMSND